MTTPVAVFDLDGTVTRGDTYVAFLRFVLVQRPYRLLHCMGLPWTAVKFQLGFDTNKETKVAFLTAVAGGCRRDEMQEFVDYFVRRVLRMVKARAVERIDWHRQQGHRLLLVTSSSTSMLWRLASVSVSMMS